MYPKLIWDLKKIKFNCKKILEKCNKNNIDLYANMNLTAGDATIAQELVNQGVKTLADSRIQNLKNFQHLKVRKFLLEIPQPSEVTELVQYTDESLISEVSTIKLINKKAKELNKIYELILLIDANNLYEGLISEEIIIQTVRIIIELTNVRLKGIGVNFLNHKPVFNLTEKVDDLITIQHQLEEEFNTRIPYIFVSSFLNSADWDDFDLFKKINILNIGNPILMGCEEVNEPLNFLKQNTVNLQAEILEIQSKPSSVFEKGLINKEIELEIVNFYKRAIIGLGYRDIGYQQITPKLKGAQILNQFADRLILDVSHCGVDLKIGDILEFELNYLGSLNLTLGLHLNKDYTN